MRADTIVKLMNAVDELKAYFNRDEISYQEIDLFRAQRPDVNFPVAFWKMSRSNTKRGMADLNNFSNIEMTQEEEEANVPHQETEVQIAARIATRFQVMDMMANAAINGNCRSLIVAGAPGVGKSFTILKAASTISEERCSVLKGAVTPTGLFQKLWKHRFDGHVVIFDDADDIFANERCLNFLKAACDSSDERYITWASNANQIDEDGEEIPTTFEFRGSIVFITNKDFKGEIERETRLAPHFGAMISRSHYIDIGIKSERDYIVRIKQVVMNTSMLEDYEDRVRDEIVQFIEMNASKLNELSLRMVKKIADLTRIDANNWRQIAEVTCFKS